MYKYLVWNHKDSVSKVDYRPYFSALTKLVDSLLDTEDDLLVYCTDYPLIEYLQSRNIPFKKVTFFSKDHLEFMKNLTTFKTPISVELIPEHLSAQDMSTLLPFERTAVTAEQMKKTPGIMQKTLLADIKKHAKACHETLINSNVVHTLIVSVGSKETIENHYRGDGRVTCHVNPAEVSRYCFVGGILVSMEDFTKIW